MVITFAWWLMDLFHELLINLCDVLKAGLELEKILSLFPVCSLTVGGQEGRGFWSIKYEMSFLTFNNEARTGMSTTLQFIEKSWG